jgi:hypothetical protein
MYRAGIALSLVACNGPAAEVPQGCARGPGAFVLGDAQGDGVADIADAVAIFTPSRRLDFHNTAFAELFGLEPAWLAERPTHGEVLDRLRQRRRLPETADYARWKAAEL